MNGEREDGGIVCMEGEMSCEISETLWTLDEMQGYNWGNGGRKGERE